MHTVTAHSALAMLLNYTGCASPHNSVYRQQQAAHDACCHLRTYVQATMHGDAISEKVEIRL
eukprot:3232259-Pleurochrysis_carterae.AAC.1